MTPRTDLATVLYERLGDGVAQITLNRPEHANGVVPELARDLARALDELEADLSLRVLILTGAGRQFCAGADLPTMQAYLAERLRVEQEPYNARVLFPVTQRLVSCRMPIVAAINGAAVAGGLDLALACDLRVCSRRAKLGETYINVGLAPANGGSWFLPRLIGTGLAAELAFTGDLIDADGALRMGLVNRVVEPDELLPATRALAARIAAKPRRALEATKQALRMSWQTDLGGSMSWSFWATAALQYTDDVKEAVDAAIDRRPPSFNRDQPS